MGLVEAVSVFFDVLSSQLTTHDLIGPARVDQHDRQEDQRHEEHDLQREVRASCVPNGQATFGAARTRVNELEHTEQRCQHDT